MCLHHISYIPNSIQFNSKTPEGKPDRSARKDTRPGGRRDAADAQTKFTRDKTQKSQTAGARAGRFGDLLGALKYRCGAATASAGALSVCCSGARHPRWGVTIWVASHRLFPRSLPMPRPPWPSLPRPSPRGGFGHPSCGFRHRLCSRGTMREGALTSDAPA